MKVRIKDINVDTVIGVYEWEKKKRQPLIINIEFKYDAEAATKSDNVEDVVDYIELTRKIKQEVEKTSFELVERLVDFILDMVMEDKRVKKAEVEIDKPEAMKGYARSVSVTGKRKR